MYRLSAGSYTLYICSIYSTVNIYLAFRQIGYIYISYSVKFIYKKRLLLVHRFIVKKHIDNPTRSRGFSKNGIDWPLIETLNFTTNIKEDNKIKRFDLSEILAFFTFTKTDTLYFRLLSVCDENTCTETKYPAPFKGLSACKHLAFPQAVYLTHMYNALLQKMCFSVKNNSCKNTHFHAHVTFFMSNDRCAKKLKFSFFILNSATYTFLHCHSVT
jgi:hypothetical protein